MAGRRKIVWKTPKIQDASANFSMKPRAEVAHENAPAEVCGYEIH
jgi:hypothetical protein